MRTLVYGRGHQHPQIVQHIEEIRATGESAAGRNADAFGETEPADRVIVIASKVADAVVAAYKAVKVAVEVVADVLDGDDDEADDKPKRGRGKAAKAE